MNPLSPTVIYAIVFASITSILLARILVALLQQALSAPLVRTWIFDHVQAHLLRRSHLGSNPTRLDMLLHCLYWSGTSIFNLVGTSSVQEVSQRALRVTTFNFVPLLLGDRLDIVSSLLKISRRSYRAVHGSIGAMTVVQMLLHVVLRLVGQDLTTVGRQDRYALAALASLSLLALLAAVRNWVYEVFLATHQILMVCATICIWRYQEPDSLARLWIIIGSSAYGALTVVRLAHIAYINWRPRFGWSYGEIMSRSSDSATFEFKIALARPTKLACGQYANLIIPGASLSAIFQRHPFTIAWWEDDKSGRAKTVSFLIRPRRGLTSRLASFDAGTRLKVAFEGPYGSEIDLLPYASVLLFATGPGIAALMPVLKSAVDRRQSSSTCLKRIALFWDMRREDRDIIGGFMEDVLSKETDTLGVLDVTVYAGSEVLAADSQQKTEWWGERAKMKWETPDIREILDTEARCTGRVMICISSVETMRLEILTLCRTAYSGRFSVQEMDFRPHHT